MRLQRNKLTPQRFDWRSAS